MLLESPTVSIIVFADEDIGYLGRTIQSILQQTYEKYEILVFSNQYDQFQDWFKHRKDQRLSLIESKNLGMAQIFNQGILQAKGKYISFMIAGDLWHPSKLQKQVSYLDCYADIGLTHSWLRLIDSQGKSSGELIKQHFYSWAEPKILSCNYISPSSVMIRRNCFDDVGLFDLRLQVIPDWDLWIRLSDRYQFMPIRQSLVYCRKYQTRIAENFSLVETDLQTIIEKAYGQARIFLLQPKRLAYSHASLFLASKVLQSKNPDAAIVKNYSYQAIDHYPLISLSPNFWRIHLKLITLHCYQSDRLSSAWNLILALGHLLKNSAYKIRDLCHKLLHWMLEEEEITIFWKNGKIKPQSKD